MRIPLSRPDVDERDIEAVTQCLRSGRLSLGPLLEEFESKFAAFIGTRYAVATSSGTAALHLCVKALGIGPDHEAITTAFSFVASTNCLLYERACPSFADIDPHSLNLAPDEIRKLIGRDYVRDNRSGQMLNRSSGRALRAILPVHVFGLPCDMVAIIEIAREFDLRVIEDACEALGAECRDRRVGSFGDAAVFAFYPNKQLTTAEGGMIVTDDAQLASLCRSLRNQGRAENGAWLLHEHLGFNYRLSELHCALGISQLERIDELLSGRERVARLYARGLADVPGIEVPTSRFANAKRSWFAYVIQLLGPSPSERRDELIKALHAKGIDCRPYFPAIHLQPYFPKLRLDSPGALPHTESAAARCLALPFFPSITAEQVHEICAEIGGILGPADAPARITAQPCRVAQAEMTQ
ncbi:MAG: DegT/DnrJ/EryC1/StrS family aminotransferase [Candidatus Acidiferrales bacterium]